MQTRVMADLKATASWRLTVQSVLNVACQWSVPGLIWWKLDSFHAITVQWRAGEDGASRARVFLFFLVYWRCTMKHGNQCCNTHSTHENDDSLRNERR